MIDLCVTGGFVKFDMEYIFFDSEKLISLIPFPFLNPWLWNNKQKKINTINAKFWNNNS